MSYLRFSMFAGLLAVFASACGSTQEAAGVVSTWEFTQDTFADSTLIGNNSASNYYLYSAKVSCYSDGTAVVRVYLSDDDPDDAVDYQKQFALSGAPSAAEFDLGESKVQFGIDTCSDAPTLTANVNEAGEFSEDAAVTFNLVAGE